MAWKVVWAIDDQTIFAWVNLAKNTVGTTLYFFFLAQDPNNFYLQTENSG